MKKDLGPTDEEHLFECSKDNASHARTYSYNVLHSKNT